MAIGRSIDRMPRVDSLAQYLKLRVDAWKAPANDEEQALNRDLAGYPSNHTYRVVGKRIIPSIELYRRWRAISGLYPTPVRSLLDIGCCQGVFVLQAASSSGCKSALGIDA